MNTYDHKRNVKFAPSASGAVEAIEYTYCISAEGKEPPLLNECHAYDTKQSDYEVPVMVKLWGMWSTPSLPSLPGPLWPGMITPERILYIGQIELYCVLMLNWYAWNRTVFYI